jgi:hypothetical protein
MFVFRNPNDPDNEKAIARLRQLVIAHLALDAGCEVLLEEVACSDPGCADKETRIVVSAAGSAPQVYRIHKPLVFVRKYDIEQLAKNSKSSM